MPAVPGRQTHELPTLGRTGNARLSCRHMSCTRNVGRTVCTHTHTQAHTHSPHDGHGAVDHNHHRKRCNHQLGELTLVAHAGIQGREHGVACRNTNDAGGKLSGSKPQDCSRPHRFNGRASVPALGLDQPKETRRYKDSTKKPDSPEKQNRNRPSVTGTPDQLTNGGCWCVKPVTAAPSQPTRASSATDANMPPTDRNDSSDRSRSHTVGSTSRAASSTSVCTSTAHHSGQRPPYT